MILSKSHYKREVAFLAVAANISKAEAKRRVDQQLAEAAATAGRHVPAGSEGS